MGPYAATNGQRHEALLRRTGSEIVHRAAVLVRCVDVEEAELVRTRTVIGLCLFDRIARILEVDEIDALHHAAVAIAKPELPP